MQWHTVATVAPECVPTTSADSPSSRDDQTGETLAHSGSPGESTSPVVPRASSVLVRGTGAGAGQTGHAVAS